MRRTGPGSKPEITPKVPEITPKVPKITPKVPEITPKVPQITPKVPEITPKVPQITQKVPEITPKVPELTPKVPEFTSRVRSVPPIRPALLRCSAQVDQSASGCPTRGRVYCQAGRARAWSHPYLEPTKLAKVSRTE
jgi:hypothetical protein